MLGGSDGRSGEAAGGEHLIHPSAPAASHFSWRAAAQWWWLLLDEIPSNSPADTPLH